MSKQSEILKDYSPKDWEAFKTLGLGKVLFQFLKDSKEQKRQQCLSLFDGNAINEQTLKLVEQKEMATAIINELLNLELKGIIQFYEEQDEQI